MTERNDDAWDFLASRRSSAPKLLSAPAPDKAELNRILTLAARSPDHGMLVPWRFIVMGPRALRRMAGEIAARGERHGLDIEKIEKGRAVYDTSPLAVVVVSAPVDSEKIPKIEQIHSAGAVCLSLVNAALAAGWAAGWVTGWASSDRRFLPTALGLTSAETIAGIVHIGTGPKPADRPRPDIEAITTWAKE